MYLKGYFILPEMPSNVYCPSERQPCKIYCWTTLYVCAACAETISATEAKGTLIFCLKCVLPHVLGEPVSHENRTFVKEVVAHTSYREDVSTSLGIWVFGNIRLSARDMASPSEQLSLMAKYPVGYLRLTDTVLNNDLKINYNRSSAEAVRSKVQLVPSFES
jgi:Zn-finger protein